MNCLNLGISTLVSDSSLFSSEVFVSKCLIARFKADNYYMLVYSYLYETAFWMYGTYVCFWFYSKSPSSSCSSPLPFFFALLLSRFPLHNTNWIPLPKKFDLGFLFLFSILLQISHDFVWFFASSLSFSFSLFSSFPSLCIHSHMFNSRHTRYMHSFQNTWWISSQKQGSSSQR